ncbi:ABC transporter substrate binding protein (PQQ-dependent alcohol dehydrogenase system) [Microvirga lupini]|uniref:ABC transporter substrate binding protein (PQQ-dependent alcohol dehydrogenase system) n=1 Tax=Microvirga lupini TaxID=420324 RepID=A0A7W4VL39_9HYPH|nr:ABC transporter substrate-binding protein [Microvirga lupini]MBB3019184.1 ABC transporter substrate binding protein (PQQ-dependent alcohol dehydrogenase system) [Microvirga lupini]
MRFSLVLLAMLMPAPVSAEERAITIAVVTQERDPVQPVSPLDREVKDQGLAGARLGTADNATTGRFIRQRFTLVDRVIPKDGNPAETIRVLAAEGIRFVVADLDAPALRAAASSEQARGMLFINVQTPDDALRNEACRANVLHTIPSRTMLADALAQYLMAKRWRRWFLVTGSQPGDKLLADAYRRAAKRFGAEIVAEKEWTFKPGHARTDTGHVTLQSEIPALTQVVDHDVLVVADEANEFGDFLPGRTARPRPVAGTQGLVTTAWSPVSEQWGATQLQARFEKLAGRRMGVVDYAAWAAVRSIGEAAIRSRSDDPFAIMSYLRSPDFVLAGFKGQGQSFRPWDGQMRQPILIAGPRLLVSVSPQAGYLHRGSELDTLGIDREESRCKF